MNPTNATPLVEVIQLVAVTFSGINLLALIVVAVKAGRFLQTFDTVVGKVAELEKRQTDDREILVRTVAIVEGLEVRLGLIEKRP